MLLLFYFLVVSFWRDRGFQFYIIFSTNLASFGPVENAQVVRAIRLTAIIVLFGVSFSYFYSLFYSSLSFLGVLYFYVVFITASFCSFGVIS